MDLEQILWRWLQDLMQSEAEPAYWRRRADDLARVGTPWGDAAAEACRNHARLLGGEFDGS